MAYDLIESFPTLPRAPITEALIDIRAELPEHIGLAELSGFNRGIEDTFTERTESRSVSTRIEVSESKDPRLIVPPAEPDGFSFRAPTQRLVAQTRRDGFSLSRLYPYHDGNTFIDQAKEFWERYVRIAEPVRVTRVSVRNVNRILIPVGTEFERFILTGPEIARSLPQNLLHFFLRLVIPDQATGALALVTETIAPADEAEIGVIPFVFDIEASLDVSLPPQSDGIWEVTSMLRKFKNRIFFRSLTTEAMESFR
jgi:uncharacterized protein (TIGR04255 family)